MLLQLAFKEHIFAAIMQDWSSDNSLVIRQYSKNPRVRTLDLRTCQGKICNLDLLYIRTCLA